MSTAVLVSIAPCSQLITREVFSVYQKLTWAHYRNKFKMERGKKRSEKKTSKKLFTLRKITLYNLTVRKRERVSKRERNSE